MAMKRENADDDMGNSYDFHGFGFLTSRTNIYTPGFLTKWPLLFDSPSFFGVLRLQGRLSAIMPVSRCGAPPVAVVGSRFLELVEERLGNPVDRF